MKRIKEASQAAHQAAHQAASEIQRRRKHPSTKVIGMAKSHGLGSDGALGTMISNHVLKKKFKKHSDDELKEIAKTYNTAYDRIK